jgi:Icc-related predicted phosphoesterase
LLRLFFATDVHGSDICWRKLVNAGAFYDATVLVLGGDIAGKAVLLLEERDGAWTASRGGREYRAETREELERLARETRNAGFYPYVAGPDEAEAFRSSQEERDRVFERLVRKSLARWVEFADERLGGTGRTLIVTSGNDDPFFCDDAFDGAKTVRQAEGEVVALDDEHEMVSLGWTPPTPWHTHRECSEEELAAKISEQARALRRPERAIFNLHAPPFNSGLDSAPKLDENLRPVEGGATSEAVGSRAVREAIEEYRPLLGLHGHIHEARGATKVGKTLCLNPGSVYGQGLLAGALVALDKGKVRGYQLVEG